MRKYSLLIFIILFAGCSAQAKEIKKEPVKPEVKQQSEIVIKGKVEFYNEKEIYIVENWTSRSRISYKIINKKEADTLKKMKDSIVEAKGIIVKNYSIWNKDFKLISFKKIK